MTGDEFATKYGVTMDYVSHGAQVDDDGWEHNAYTLTLAYGTTADPNGTSVTGGRREVKVPWKQGYSVEESPEVGSCLEHVAGELSDDVDSFDDWAEGYGYDTDSRRAYATWLAVKSLQQGLYTWCRSEAMWDDLRSVRES